MIGFSLGPLRLEPGESASLGDSYHVRRVRLNLMTLQAELLRLPGKIMGNFLTSIYIGGMINKSRVINEPCIRTFRQFLPLYS